MRPSRHLIAYALLALALLASLAGNYFLFQKAILFYAREAQVRIEPISDRYAEENAHLRAQEKSKPRIVMFGESRCGMWRAYPASNWGDIEIVNRGIGGETTPQIIRRLEDDVLSLDPDVVILQMGDNDLKTMAVLPGTRERTIEQTYDNITAIAKRLSENGIQVIITTIFPPAPIELLRAPLWSDEVNEAIDIVNQRLLAFSYPRVEIANCDPILRDGKYIKAEYSIDTLHLKKAGYQALNQGLEPIVTKAILASAAR
ncbi:GDSL-type esterase/lipase family protein [Pelagicoccus sp. SDUM812005]|uniref:SGNH/GDSL hydrolase family protein n=1 Tax=Pelagicoccus sp. SDUM812005 TaxID=3041257 RepID=UPI00280C777F|nr:GDSL-type esterase/lipase family protein [Pelagicoccus sp. SDUM812005]MDQ8180220.1 GDSL-type esterase/lipase family protein [Pelagicoccus sp. SDUM812005]